MTFSLSFPSAGGIEVQRGDVVSINFPDGKGVSARLADVSIASGGTPFSIICTDDGQWPDARPETLADGVYAVGEGDVPASGLTTLTERLGAMGEESVRLRMELELSRQRAVDLAQQERKAARRVDGLTQALSDTREQVADRDEQIQHLMGEAVSREQAYQGSQADLRRALEDLHRYEMMHRAQKDTIQQLRTELGAKEEKSRTVNLGPLAQHLMETVTINVYKGASPTSGEGH